MEWHPCPPSLTSAQESQIGVEEHRFGMWPPWRHTAQRMFMSDVPWYFSLWMWCVRIRLRDFAHGERLFTVFLRFQYEFCVEEGVLSARLEAVNRILSAFKLNIDIVQDLYNTCNCNAVLTTTDKHQDFTCGFIFAIHANTFWPLTASNIDQPKLFNFWASSGVSTSSHRYGGPRNPKK